MFQVEYIMVASENRAYPYQKMVHLLGKIWGFTDWPSASSARRGHWPGPCPLFRWLSGDERCRNMSEKLSDRSVCLWPNDPEKKKDAMIPWFFGGRSCVIRSGTGWFTYRIFQGEEWWQYVEWNATQLPFHVIHSGWLRTGFHNGLDESIVATRAVVPFGVIKHGCGHTAAFPYFPSISQKSAAISKWRLRGIFRVVKPMPWTIP